MKTTSARPFASTLPLLAAAGLLVGGPPAARAAIQVLAPMAATAGSFTITAPISFTITSASTTARLFILDEWVTSDGTFNATTFAPTLNFTLNGNPVTTTGGSFADNYNSNQGARTPNDGYFLPGSNFTVAVGDTVTLSAATYSLAAAANFNPQATQTFTGNMFLTDTSSARISNIVSAGAVPEPSTYALALAGGAALLGAIRSRRRCR